MTEDKKERRKKVRRGSENVERKEGRSGGGKERKRDAKVKSKQVRTEERKGRKEE